MASRRQQLLPLPTAGRASPRIYSYFAALGYEIHLIGVEFSRQTRNVTAFEVADA